MVKKSKAILNLAPLKQLAKSLKLNPTVEVGMFKKAHIDKVIWNEFGTHTASGAVKAPPRPFISTTVNKHQRRYMRAFTSFVTDCLITWEAKPARLEKLLQAMSENIARDMQYTIKIMKTPPTPPLSSAWVKYKGHAKFWIYTQGVYNNIEGRAWIK